MNLEKENETQEVNSEVIFFQKWAKNLVTVLCNWSPNKYISINPAEMSSLNPFQNMVASPRQSAILHTEVAFPCQVL